jgi:uncharacterized repeat protein (TIGR02543 family)
MESRTLRCTSCGLIVDDHGDEHLITCKACGNQYLASDGMYLSLKTQKEIDRLKNVRIRLDEVKTFNDYTMIYTHAEAILQIIPDDVLGHYYFAYAAYFMHQRKPLEVFLNREAIEASQAHTEEILLHMGHYMDIKEYDAILKFTERHQKHLFKTVKEALQKRIALEDHYAVVKRDVFICHRSTDREITQSIVTKLEQDGYTCWVSERNLRPDDNENYWKNIEEAIEHCTVFLVVSSQAAMLSKDVQRELSYANKLQKRKLEFKIDDSVHTTLFKHSFDGIKWIDGKDENAFLQLSNRLYGYIHVTDTEKLVSQSASNQFSSLYKKIEIALKTLKFKQAKTLLQELKTLDEGHELVWLSELYIEHKLHDMKAVLTFFEQASKTQLERFKKSSSYLNYERLFPQSELNHRLSETYQKVVKKHRKQQVRLAIVSVVIAILLSVSSVVTYQNIEQTIQFELNQEIYTLNETLTESGYQNKAGSLNLPIPETQGYTFMGWYDNPNFEGNRVEAITPKLSVSRSYYAKWEVNLYTITWETLEGGDIEETKIAYLNTITLPTNPTKEGYTFSGWYLDSGLTTPFTLTTMTSQNITLYAKWTIQRFTVIYQDSDFNMISTDTYAYGTEKNSITIPNDPYKEGYTFTGWSIALPNTITTNLTLTATYSINSYQVTFQTNGGSLVGLLSLEYQSTITLPINPTKEGYTFSGWYLDSGLTTPFTLTMMTSQNITLYAKWIQINTLTVSFDSKGGTSVEEIEVEKGAYLQAPQVFKEGYTFDGWYTSQNSGDTLDEKWSFINNAVQFELTIYAKWTINQYTVSFNTDGGTVILPLTVDYNSVITLPENPTKEGHNFIGWAESAPVRVPAEDITIEAIWQVNQYTISYYTFEHLDDEKRNILLFESESIIQTSIGGAHSGILTSFGRILVWGSNSKGQLGFQNTLEISYIPRDISNLFNLNLDESIIKISLGGSHSSLLTSQGRVFTWGSNNSGELGNGSNQDTHLPFDITNNFNLIESEFIIDINLKSNYSSVLTNFGSVFMWGNNSYGKLGNNSYNNSNLPIDITNNIEELNDHKIIQIELGENHVVALASNGTTYIWGSNSEDQTLIGDRTIPQEVGYFNQGTIGQAIKVFVGYNHSAVITLNSDTSNSLIVWGDSYWLGLGTQGSSSFNITDKFDLHLDEYIVDLSLGWISSSLLTSKGRVFVWGNNSSGRLGIDDISYSYNPIEITNRFELNDNEIITKIEMSANASIAVTSFNNIYIWGANVNYQIPIEGQDNLFKPVAFTNKIIKYEEVLLNYNTLIESISIEESAYEFKGWYTDPSLKIRSTFIRMPDEDLNLYPKWEKINTLNVNFDSNGGSNINSVIVEKGDYLLPPQVSKEGYTFDGWYTSQNGGTTLDDKWSFINNTVQFEITLYAKWIINQYTLSFNTNGGTVISSVILDYNNEIQLPENPTKIHFLFEGWYIDSDFISLFSDKEMPAENKILYAKWLIDHDKLVYFEGNYYGVKGDNKIYIYDLGFNEINIKTSPNQLDWNPMFSIIRVDYINKQLIVIGTTDSWRSYENYYIDIYNLDLENTFHFNEQAQDRTGSAQPQIRDVLYVNSQWKIYTFNNYINPIRYRVYTIHNGNVTKELYDEMPSESEIINADLEQVESFFPKHIEEPTIIHLPINGPNGSIIEWSTKDVNLFNISSGEVYIPEVGQQLLLLTAVFKYGITSETKEIVIIVGND